MKDETLEQITAIFRAGQPISNEDIGALLDEIVRVREERAAEKGIKHQLLLRCAELMWTTDGRWWSVAHHVNEILDRRDAEIARLKESNERLGRYAFRWLYDMTPEDWEYIRTTRADLVERLYEQLEQAK